MNCPHCDKRIELVRCPWCGEKHPVERRDGSMSIVTCPQLSRNQCFLWDEGKRTLEVPPGVHVDRCEFNVAKYAMLCARAPGPLPGAYHEPDDEDA